MLPVLYILGILAGLATLVQSTDVFLDKAVAVAKHFNLSLFFTGVFIVGFGTSLPELGIALAAAWQQSPLLAVSSAVGSNIANIALVWGCALGLVRGTMRPVGHFLDTFLLFSISILLILCAWDLHLSRLDALILLLAFVGFVILQCKNPAPASAEDAAGSDEGIHYRDYIFLALALAAVLISAQVIATCARYLSSHFHISESFIGLTLLALGSSLPELVSSLIIIKKGLLRMIFGNIIGSNILNTLLVITAAILVHPASSLPKELITRDMMLGATLSCILIAGTAFQLWKRAWARKTLAALLLAFYGWYIAAATLSLSPTS